jgi:hypothetical protein
MQFRVQTLVCLWKPQPQGRTPNCLLQSATVSEACAGLLLASPVVKFIGKNLNLEELIYV